MSKPDHESQPRTARRLAAIMFTDIVGYSAITQRNEALALSLLDEHNGLVRAALAAHAGREIKTVGDAFLAEFDSALEAVRCAVRIQSDLNGRNQASGVEPIEIRIGIHLGDVVYRENDVFGDGVNIAARVQSSAGAGEIRLSDDVARQVGNKLGMALLDLGLTPLKNIDQPMRLFSVALPWRPSTVEQSPSAINASAGAQTKQKRNRLPAVGLMIVAVVVIAGGTTWLMRKPAPVADATMASSSSEVKALVAQVEGLIRDPMTATRENYVLADELMQRVLKLESNHADYWILAARVSMRLSEQNYDRSAERRQKATEQVDRALKLAPSSLAAKAVQLRREFYFGSLAETESIAREILARDPSNRDALAVKLSIARRQGSDSDADALRARLMQLPGGDPLSLLFDTLMLGRRGQLSAAEKSYGELLKLSPTRIVYTVGLELQKDYFLDAQGAVDFIDRIPEKLRSEDAIAAHAALALIFVGRGAEAVATLNRLPRDYISEFLFNLPKGQIAGLAHEVAGQPAAAAVEWRNALSLVEKRLAAEPSNLVLLGNKAQLQAMLGQKAAALETLQLHIELGGKDNPPFLADRVRVLVRCGITEDAVEVIEREWPNANLIRRNALIRELVFLPEYATFRKDKHIAPLIQAHQAFVKAARAAPGSKP